MSKIYLSLLITTFGYAQSVDFQDIIKLTLNNNKDLKNQTLQIENSKLDIKNIKAISLGKLTLSEEISRTNHSGYVFNSKLSSREASFNDFGASQYQNPNDINVIPENLNNPKDRNNFNTKLSYDIPIFTGFKLTNQENILNLQNKAQELKYNLNEKELSYEALRAYNGAVVAKEYIQAIEKSKESINQVVKSATSFFDEGLVTKIDVKQAKVYELNVNSQLIQAKNQFEQSLAYLRFLTTKDEIYDVKELKSFASIDENLSHLYKIALDNRDEVKMQNIQIDASKKNIEISKSSYYPSIYSHIEYGFNDNKLSLDTNKDYYLAMVSVNLNLFDVNRNIQKQKSKIEYKKENNNFEKLKNAIKLELSNALLDLKTKEKILNEKIEEVNLANDIFEQSTLMYKNHLISMTNLLQQEANLRNAQAQLINSKYEKSLAQGKLMLIIGKNLIDLKDEN